MDINEPCTVAPRSSLPRTRLAVTRVLLVGAPVALLGPAMGASASSPPPSPPPTVVVDPTGPTTPGSTVTTTGEIPLLVDIAASDLGVAVDNVGGIVLIDYATSTATVVAADGTQTVVDLEATPISPIAGPDGVLYGTVTAEDGTTELVAIALTGDTAGTVVASVPLLSTSADPDSTAPIYGQGSVGLIDRSSGGVTLLPYVDATGAPSGASVEVPSLRAAIEADSATVSAFGVAPDAATATSWTVGLADLPGLTAFPDPPGALVPQLGGGAVWVLAGGPWGAAAPAATAATASAPSSDAAGTVATPEAATPTTIAPADPAATTMVAPVVAELGADGTVAAAVIEDGWLVGAADVGGVVLVRSTGEGVEVSRLAPAVVPPVDGTAPSSTPASSAPATTEPRSCDDYTDSIELPLELCDSGAAVEVAQRALEVSGADVSVDGNFGPMTEEAVRAFQDDNGLEVDGLIGLQTWDALTALLPPQGNDDNGDGSIDPGEYGLGGEGTPVGPGFRWTGDEGPSILDADSQAAVGEGLRLHRLGSDPNYVLSEVTLASGTSFLWASRLVGTDEDGYEVFELLDVAELPPSDFALLSFGCSNETSGSTELVYVTERDPDSGAATGYGPGWQFDAANGTFQQLDDGATADCPQ